VGTLLRPHIQELFINVPRRIEVGFHTSSLDKFLQARMVLQEFGLRLRHFVSSQDPYQEDYSQTEENLLTNAINEVRHRLGVESLFFVEDTSLRIEALSSEKEDFPGPRVKEWFAETDFSELDQELRKRGRGRDATVRSDIALHVPRLQCPVFFHGETKGTVAETPPSFEQSDQCPWLSPNTFNGWFIPHGTSKRLGEMSFEESWNHDFRVRSLCALVARLEEYAAVLNLSPHSYSTKRPLSPSPGPLLFPTEVDLLVVVGLRCAGKTTLGQYLASRHDFRFIEASSIVRMLQREVDVQTTDAFHLASEVLRRKGPDIVARQIVGMWGNELQNRCVITGFRTIEEVEFIREKVPGCQVVLIEASERTRFERHLRRARLGSLKTMADFRRDESQQTLFGLLGVARDLADISIENEGSIEEFYGQIEAVVGRRTEGISGVSRKTRDLATIMAGRLFRCLCVLDRTGCPQSCPEIGNATDKDDSPGGGRGERISARHVNWVLRDVPELARRIDARGDRVRYELMPAGRAYLRSIRAASKLDRGVQPEKE